MRPGLTLDAPVRPALLYDQLDSASSDRSGDPANWTVERFVVEVNHVRKRARARPAAGAGQPLGGSMAATYASGQPPGLAGLVPIAFGSNSPRRIVVSDAAS